MMLTAVSPMGIAIGKSAALPAITVVEAQERSDIGAVLIVTTRDGGGFAETLSKALGCTLPLTHGDVLQTVDKRAIWLTPRSWIILCAPDDEADLVAAINKAFPDREANASRFSDALAWLTLDGEAAENLLRQGSFLSFEPLGFPIGHGKRTPLAGIPAIILRESEARWTIGVERSRAQYFCTWLAGLTNSFEAAQ